MKYARVELHLHLDGSMNVKWLYDKSIERKTISPDTTFEEFYDILYSRNSYHSAESIKKFDITCNVMQSREDLIEVTYNLVKHLDDLGLFYAEIRFASQQHCKGGLTQLEALQAVCDGAKKAMSECSIKVGIINCLMHKGDSAAFNMAENLETIEASKTLYGKGVCGIDLAGFENNCDFNEYAPLFEKVREYNIPYTIHAGEMGIASHIIDALNMKPHRIGHGVNAVNDEKILQTVVDCQIPLEVCVTSNVKANMNYSSHPIRKLLEAGCNVTLNSDNMMFSRTNIINEHNQLEMLGITQKQLKQCTINAIKAAFTDEETKQELLRKIEDL